jgi:hypothetical protein
MRKTAFGDDGQGIRHNFQPPGERPEDRGPQWAASEIANRNVEHYTPRAGAREYVSLSPDLNLD